VGLFSFVGKAVKGIGKVVGGVVKVGLGAAKLAGSLGLGGPLGSIASKLLSSKSPMSHAVKIATALQPQGTVRMRGNVTQSGFGHFGTYRGAFPGPQVLRMSPVLPGGAVATAGGPAAASSSVPPTSYGGRRATTKRKRTTKRTTKRRSGRKLKFGSPAWRKKYLKKRRR
jgi:hypothetical protein